MEVAARRISDESANLVHADIVYGDVDMASEVGRIAARVLVPGGVLALISGNLACLDVQNAIVAEGLWLITIGSLHLRGGYPCRPGAFCRVDSLPVFFFARRSEKLARPLDHLAFESPVREVTRRAWGRTRRPPSISSGLRSIPAAACSIRAAVRARPGRPPSPPRVLVHRDRHRRRGNQGRVGPAGPG